MAESTGTRPIETGRLLLRRFVLSDAKAVFECWSHDPEAARFLRGEPHRNLGEARENLAEWVRGYGDESGCLWAVTRRQDGALVGALRAFDASTYDRRCELLCCIGRRYRGSGYAAEAARAAVDFLLIDAGFNRAEACCPAADAAAGRALQRAGLLPEGTARQRMRGPAGFEDCRLYGVVRSELYLPAASFAWKEPGVLADGEIELACTARGQAVPEKRRVPYYDFEIRKNGERAGRITLRVGFTEGLYYGGQLGFEVEEKFQGRHYAARACGLLRLLALRHGYRRVLITNSPQNAASRRTCELIGARLVRIAVLPVWTDHYAAGERRVCIWEWDVTRRSDESVT